MTDYLGVDIRNVTRFNQGETECAVGRCVKGVDPAIGAPLCTHHAKLVFAKVAHIYGMVPPKRTKAKPARSTVSPVGTVYIVQHGDRIKIGFTRNLARRMTEVHHEKVLTTFAGKVEAEQALHAKFAHIRTVGEWFQATPELIGFAEAIEEQQTKRRVGTAS